MNELKTGTGEQGLTYCEGQNEEHNEEKKERKRRANVFFDGKRLKYQYIYVYLRSKQFNYDINMKDFIKYVLATFVGLLLFLVVFVIFGVMSLVGMVASGEATKNVKENSVLVVNLSGVMEERASENVFGQFTGNAFNNLGLEETLSAIKKAKANENIKGIYIECGALSADMAQIQELRDQLLDFKKSGKWIVAYGDIYTQGAYYVSTTANKLYVNPQGSIDWHGIGVEPIFVKDLLAKFGVKMQVIKVGKYKSATEMFTGSVMSEANREQTQRYVDGLWANVCKGVSESRKISVEKLNQLADNSLVTADAQTLVKEKMVDGLRYAEQVKAEVKKMLEVGDDEDICQLSVADMVNVKDESERGDDEIAVYYAYGDIVQTSVGGSLSNTTAIVGADVCRDLEKLAKDDDVKAVVIRVNSGGGSAYASEQIWHQVEMLRKEKPVVVSMGGKAASGGYYMSCNANYIFAEPTTLTGSIGIFGIVPDNSELLTQKLGLKFDAVKTNRNSLFGTSSRPMNDEEIGYLTASIGRGYELFRKRVADGRKMTVDQVEAIAQGHVFTGEDALKIKLVDELGGLDKAVAKAAQLAKAKSYYTRNYPEPTDFWDQLMNETSGSYLDGKMRAALGVLYEPVMMLQNVNNTDRLQARLPYWINVK